MEKKLPSGFNFSITLLPPDEKGDDTRINLFLYKVHESQYLKNMDWKISKNDTSQITPPPLSLNLF